MFSAIDEAMKNIDLDIAVNEALDHVELFSAIDESMKMIELYGVLDEAFDVVNKQSSSNNITLYSVGGSILALGAIAMFIKKQQFAKTDEINESLL